jgi:hypothetical protein
MNILAVDPGDKHVGTALWRFDRPAIRAKEYDATEWLPIFSCLIRRVDVVIIEEFRLYACKAAAQSGSPMATAEMIGAMKWIAWSAPVPVVMQPASIKKPTERQALARGLVCNVKSRHAADAWLHLVYYLLRTHQEVA